GRLHQPGRPGHRPQAAGRRDRAGRALHLDLRLCHRHRRAAARAPAHQRQPVRPHRRGAAVRRGAGLDAERGVPGPGTGKMGRRLARAAAGQGRAGAARFRPAGRVRAAARCRAAHQGRGPPPPAPARRARTLPPAPAPKPTPVAAPAPAAEPDPVAPEAHTDAAKPAAPAAPQPADAGQPAPAPAPDGWRISVDAININDFGLRLRDAATQLDYALAGMAVTVENVQFPQPPDRPIHLWLTMDNPADGGWIRAKGPLMLNPLALDLDLRAGHLALAPFAPAVRSQAPIQLLDGLLGRQARVNVAEKNGATQVWATGVKADLSKLSVRDESVKPAVALALDQLTLAADRIAL